MAKQMKGSPPLGLGSLVVNIYRLATPADLLNYFAFLLNFYCFVGRKELLKMNETERWLETGTNRDKTMNGKLM